MLPAMTGRYVKRARKLARCAPSAGFGRADQVIE
jgi:hypothetical protein